MNSTDPKRLAGLLSIVFYGLYVLAVAVSIVLEVPGLRRFVPILRSTSMLSDFLWFFVFVAAALVFALMGQSRVRRPMTLACMFALLGLAGIFEASLY